MAQYLVKDQLSWLERTVHIGVVADSSPSSPTSYAFCYCIDRSPTESNREVVRRVAHGSFIVVLRLSVALQPHSGVSDEEMCWGVLGRRQLRAQTTWGILTASQVGDVQSRSGGLVEFHGEGLVASTVGAVDGDVGGRTDTYHH